MADISKIVLPDNTEYDIKDAGALQPDTDARLRRLYIKDDRYTDGDLPTIFIGTTGDDAKSMWYTSPASQYSRICNYTGSSLHSGVDMLDNGEVRLFGNGNNVILRPNGANSTNGQVYWDTNGQQHNGQTLRSFSGSKSLSANADTVVHSFSLDSGTWICSAFLNCNTPSNNYYNHSFDIPNVYTKIIRNTMHNGGGDSMCCIFKLNSSATVNIKAYVETACTVTSGVDCLRVG